MTEVRVVTGRSADGRSIVRVSLAQGVITEVENEPIGAESSLPILTPGLVDVQVNGYAGYDINAEDVSPATVADLSRELARSGVTTWAPTIITASEDRIVNAIQQIEAARAADENIRRAIPGIHVEGPFISDRDGARGVHDREAVRPLDAAEVERWTKHGPIALVTVSPHTAGAPEQIRRIRGLGVDVAIGHTHAMREQIERAVDAGARFSTHLGNGIPMTIHRHDNPIWAQLADQRLSAGFIADGHHLPADVLRTMLRAKGVDRSFLVSDLTTLGGLAPGRYRTPVGGLVELDDSNRLAFGDTGMLAGAAATLIDGLRNVIAVTGLGLDQALPLVTRNPARLLSGARHGLGAIAVGAPADLVLHADDLGAAAGPVQVVQNGRDIR